MGPNVEGVIVHFEAACEAFAMRVESVFSVASFDVWIVIVHDLVRRRGWQTRCGSIRT